MTQRFNLSNFTDFCYQSIKITWLLSIFTDTDFYQLTTPASISIMSAQLLMCKIAVFTCVSFFSPMPRVARMAHWLAVCQDPFQTPKTSLLKSGVLIILAVFRDMPNNLNWTDPTWTRRITGSAFWISK